MPGHGDHWETLYSAEDYVKSKISRDIQEGLFVGRADCVDVEGGTDRTEQVMCLRWGTDHLANQMLVVSNSAKQSNFLFSGYPVVLDGTPTEVTVSKVEPWEYGIEGWVHGSVAREGASICFFDTMYFLISNEPQPPESNAGVAARRRRRPRAVLYSGCADRSGG